MIYCMSDIHGEYDRYLAMLEQIQFSDWDTLYVIGDAIDRFPNGVDILMDMMSRENIHLIVGNHEQMLIDTLGPNNVYGARQLWQQNGGSPTRRELLYHRTMQEKNKILRYIQNAPDHIDLEVNGRKFHLVHGLPGNNREDRIWGRPGKDITEPIPGTTVIVGHTPTNYLAGDNGFPFRIWHGVGIIDIDCGCGHQTNLRRLACLRLDDLAEFYI